MSPFAQWKIVVRGAPGDSGDILPPLANLRKFVRRTEFLPKPVPVSRLCRQYPRGHRPLVATHAMDAEGLFEILMREHAGMLTVYLRSVVHDPASEDDLFQET